MKHDVRFAKFVVIVNGVVPAALLAWDAYHHRIGVNGVNYALHTTGLLSFTFLLLSLLVTPLRKVTGWNTLISFRRALGLYGFFYACSHFLIFFAFDRALSVSSTVHEILFRRYLQIGTTGLLLMVPLALTSTNAMVMRLGAKRWKSLHRLTYVVAIAASVHYYLLVKSDVRQPLVFAGVLTALLGYRVVNAIGQRRKTPAPGRGHPLVAATSAAPAKPRFWSGELRVARIFDETPDVRTFRLVAEDGGELPFNHRPGQYLNLALTINGKRVNRSYTIASSPTRGHYCEVTVKRSAVGHGSWHLHDTIRAGAKLKVSAPAGRFVFDGMESDQVVLIGGGVGITPMMSIVRYLTDRCWAGDIFLFFSVRKQTDLIFREELAYLARRFPNLHVCLTLTTKEQEAGWTGQRGAITRQLLTSVVPDLKRGPAYICGPDGMMATVRALLLDMGLVEANVRTEAFVSPPPVSAVSPDAADPVWSTGDGDSDGDGRSSEKNIAPPPDAGQQASIRFERSAQVISAPTSQTILEAAEAAGIELPFECRSGICGQCKTRLLAGRVTMDSEDALSATEKARGLILACQAHASGNVTLDA